MPSLPRTAALVAACALLTTAVSGCTESATPPSEASASPASPKSVTGKEVCGGLLEGSGERQLEELLHWQTFIDDRETMKIDSLAEAARILTRETKPGNSRNLCRASATDNDRSDYVQVEANWYSLKKADFSDPVGEDTTAFNLTGVKKQSYARQYAFAADKFSLVTFRCPVGIGEKEGNVVQVLASTGKEQTLLDPTERRERLIRIGATAAARLASALGCLKESGLPSPVGELTPVPTT